MPLESSGDGFCSGIFAPVVVVLVGGGYESLKAACQRLESKVPVVVVNDTGPAANLIAETYKKFITARNKGSTVMSVIQLES